MEYSGTGREMRTMKSKFSTKLFLDGFRQLRLIGLTSLVIFAIEAFFAVISNQVVATSVNYAYDADYAAAIAPQVSVYNLLEIHPILLAAFYVVVPVMLLYLFGFLNHRSSSDFYHSIPVKRECLAISFLAAIMAWIAIISVGSTIVTCVTALFCKYVSINMPSVFIALLGVLAAAFCVLGAGLLAMSLTGTYFSNFSVSVMILVFPRLLLLAVSIITSELISVISYNPVNTVLDFRLNIILGTILGWLEYNDAFYPLEHLLPSLYTFILGLVYMGIGLRCFRKRRSEIATTPAVNSRLQLLFRLTPATAISLIPLGLICELAWGADEATGEYLLTIVILYVIALIAYFLYEIISSHRLSGIIKCIRQLWILVAVNVAIFAVVSLGRTIVMNDVPTASQVHYVTITSTSRGSNDYVSAMTNKIRLTDPSVINDAVKALASSVDQEKTKGYISGYNQITIRYNLGFRSITRYVWFETRKEYQNFLMDLYACDDYADIYRKLPSADQLQNMYISRKSIELSDADIAEIYEVLREDCSQLTGKQIQEYLSDSDMDSFVYLSATYSEGSGNYRLSLPLSLSKSAQTLLFKKINQGQDVTGGNPISQFLSLVPEMKQAGTSDYINVSFILINRSDFSYYSGSASQYLEYNENGIAETVNTDYTDKGLDILQEMSKKLDTMSDTITDDTQSVVLVTVASPDSPKAIQHCYVSDAEFEDLALSYIGY
jgi:ABC-2 type transport system permease protein